MRKKLPKPNKQCKNQCGLLRELHSRNGVMCLIFAGIIWTSSFYFFRSSLLLSLVPKRWESLFLFQWVFEQIHKDKSKTVLKDLPCISCWLQQDLQPCLHGKIWDRNSLLFFCTTYASKAQVEFGEQKQGMISLKVEKYSSAWIPVQSLEEGFKDEKISWCLYVIGTPFQEAAQRGSIEGETASGSPLPWEPGEGELLLLCCFSLEHTVRELSTAPTWM